MLAIITLLATVFSAPRYRSLIRVTLSLNMGFSGVIPTAHGVVLHWEVSVPFSAAASLMFSTPTSTETNVVDNALAFVLSSDGSRVFSSSTSSFEIEASFSIKPELSFEVGRGSMSREAAGKPSDTRVSGTSFGEEMVFESLEVSKFSLPEIEIFPASEDCSFPLKPEAVSLLQRSHCYPEYLVPLDGVAGADLGLLDFSAPPVEAPKLFTFVLKLALLTNFLGEGTVSPVEAAGSFGDVLGDAKLLGFPRNLDDGVLSVHAEHLRSKLPLMTEQLLWHGSWQQSEEARNVSRHDNASYYLY
uniref:Uncharacterized protein n=1 Tax=Salix viminalis TaxID=40686 RepID=A0A6N2N6X6_SALVM